MVLNSDGDFNWKPGRLYIPGNWFTGNTVAAVDEAGCTSHAVGALWASTHTGVAISSEISTFGITAPLIGAAGDMWQTALAGGMMPTMDVQYPLYFRVHWTTASTTAADDMLWKVTYKILAENTTITAASTALDKTVPNDNATGSAYQWQITDWGYADGGTFTQENAALILNVEADTVDMDVPSTEPSFFLGLELRWTPKYLQSKGSMRHEAWENYGPWAKSR